MNLDVHSNIVCIYDEGYRVYCSACGLVELVYELAKVNNFMFRAEVCLNRISTILLITLLIIALWYGLVCQLKWCRKLNLYMSISLVMVCKVIGYPLLAYLRTISGERLETLVKPRLYECVSPSSWPITYKWKLRAAEIV